MKKLLFILISCRLFGAFPSTLPSSPNGYDFGFAAYPAKGDVGFEYLGNLYAFVTQTPTVAGTHDELCHAFKSTDGGNTWVEKDLAHAPGGAAPSFSNIPAGGPQYTVARDGATALIFSAQLIAVPSIHFSQTQLIRFNLSTDLWSTITTFPDPGTLDLEAEYTGQAPGDTSTVIAVSMRLVVLGAGNYILCYSGPPDTVAGSVYGRLWYATFNGTTFGVPVKIPNQTGAFTYFGNGAVFLTTVPAVQFMYESTDTSGNSTMHSIGLNTGTLIFGTNQAIPFSAQYWNSIPQAQAVTTSDPIVYTPSGGSESIAIASEVQSPPPNNDNAHLLLALYHGTAALNITWAKSIVTGPSVDDTTGIGGRTDQTIFPVPQGTGLIGGNLTLADKNGNLALVWTIVDMSFLGHIYYASSPDNVLAWTASTLLFNNGPISGGSGDTLATQIYAFPMTGGVGVLAGANDYIDGNGNEIMQFNMIPFAGPPPPSTGIAYILSGGPGRNFQTTSTFIRSN